MLKHRILACLRIGQRPSLVRLGLFAGAKGIRTPGPTCCRREMADGQAAILRDGRGWCGPSHVRSVHGGTGNSNPLCSSGKSATNCRAHARPLRIRNRLALRAGDWGRLAPATNSAAPVPPTTPAARAPALVPVMRRRGRGAPLRLLDEAFCGSGRCFVYPQRCGSGNARDQGVPEGGNCRTT